MLDVVMALNWLFLWELLSSHTCSSSFAVARSSGFLIRHRETKSMNEEDHLSGLRNEGGGFVGIMNIA